jgi:hypothetical protein
MGGSPVTKDDAGYVPVADPFFGQHDARLQPGFTTTCSGGSGQVSLYDDHTFDAGPERAVLYDVVVALGDGSAPDCGVSGDAGSSGATVAWQYAGPVDSDGLGSFRIQADGTKVIDWGFGAGPDNLTFRELGPTGKNLLDVSLILSYRVIKVPLTAFDLNVLRSTAGQP